MLHLDRRIVSVTSCLTKSDVEAEAQRKFIETKFRVYEDALRFISILTSADCVARGAEQLPSTEVIHHTTSEHVFNEQKISIRPLRLRVAMNSIDAPSSPERNSSKNSTPNAPIKFPGILTVASNNPLDLAGLREEERNNTRSGLIPTIIRFVF